MIPGDDLQLLEPDLLQTIGKYLSLYEYEQRKRVLLIQAYNELQSKLAEVTQENWDLKNPDVVQGNP